MDLGKNEVKMIENRIRTGIKERDKKGDKGVSHSTGLSL